MTDHHDQADHFLPGDIVRSTSTDSDFTGVVVAKFNKCDGKSVRYVVENWDRILHVFAGKHLMTAGSPK